MPFAVALFLALVTQPLASQNKTAWMRPESFRLAIGMPRAAALEELSMSGWKTKPGKDANSIVVEYGEDKAVTLDFQRDRLRSLRFELFAFIPEAQDAFREQQSFLRTRFGPPRAKLKSKTIVLYDHILPNVMVVLSADPKTESGRKGLGMLVVRYFDPAGA